MSSSMFVKRKARLAAAGSHVRLTYRQHRGQAGRRSDRTNVAIFFLRQTAMAGRKVGQKSCHDLLLVGAW